MLGKYSCAVTEKVLTAEVASFVWGRLNQFTTSTYAAHVRSLTSMIFGHGGWLQFKNHFWLIAIFFFC